MLFPILRALFSGSEFQHTDPIRKELCDQMAILVAENRGNVAQIRESESSVLCQPLYYCLLFEIVTFRMNRIVRKNAVRFPKHQ